MDWELLREAFLFVSSSPTKTVPAQIPDPLHPLVTFSFPSFFTLLMLSLGRKNHGAGTHILLLRAVCCTQ